MSPRTSQRVALRLLVAILVPLLWAPPSGAAPTPQAAANQTVSTIAFTGVTVLPMESAVQLTEHTVVVREGRIAALGPDGTVAVPADAVRIEGAGRFLLPALTDMHVHLSTSEEARDDLFLFLANGVTRARIMWGSERQLEMRRQVEEDGVIGPRLIIASPGLDGPPGALSDTVYEDPQTARTAVAQFAEAGYDFIKVYNHLAAEVYEAIVAEADARGLRIAGHVPASISMEEALEDFASIEHLIGYERSVTDGEFFWGEYDATEADRLAGLTSAAGVWNTPTLMEFYRTGEPPLADDSELRFLSPTMRSWFTGWAGHQPADPVAPARRNRSRLLKALHDAGGRVLLGTDTGQKYLIPGFAVHDELAQMITAGLSGYEAIRTATANVGEFLGRPDEVGVVAIGAEADLILVDGNPFDEVSRLKRPAGVLFRGGWLTREAIDNRLEEIARSYANSE